MSPSIDLNVLIVDEEEIQTANVLILSMFIYNIKYTKIQKDVKKILVDSHRIIESKYYFKKRKGSNLREGFLHIEDINYEDNKVTCFYAKESPSKYVFANDELKIEDVRLKSITPSFSVKLIVELYPYGAKCILFGGNESLVQKVISYVRNSIRGAIEGEFEDTSHYLDQTNMWALLNFMGENVAHIWIAPGDSERFKKVVEKKQGNKVVEMLEFKVDTKLNGVRITNAPFVKDVLEEEGIRIREIQGEISILGNAITVRVSATGRVIFYVPSYIIPKTGDIYQIGEELYKRLLKNLTKGE